MAPQANVFVLSFLFFMTFPCLHWISLRGFSWRRFYFSGSFCMCACVSLMAKKYLSSITQIPSTISSLPSLFTEATKRRDGLENYKLTVIMFKKWNKCRPGPFDVDLRIFCHSLFPQRPVSSDLCFILKKGRQEEWRETWKFQTRQNGLWLLVGDENIFKERDFFKGRTLNF